MGLIHQTQLSLRDPSGRETPLVLIKSEHAYVASLPGTGPRLIHGTADLGVIQEGADKPYLLTYYPKTILGKRGMQLPGSRTGSYPTPKTILVIGGADKGRNFDLIEATSVGN